MTTIANYLKFDAYKVKLSDDCLRITFFSFNYGIFD